MTESEIRSIEDELGRQSLRREDLDCGDNSCRFTRKGGMRTNGGCRCEGEAMTEAELRELKERLDESWRCDAELGVAIDRLESAAALTTAPEVKAEDLQALLAHVRELRDALLDLVERCGVQGFPEDNEDFAAIARARALLGET